MGVQMAILSFDISRIIVDQSVFIKSLLLNHSEDNNGIKQVSQRDNNLQC